MGSHGILDFGILICTKKGLEVMNYSSSDYYVQYMEFKTLYNFFRKGGPHQYDKIRLFELKASHFLQANTFSYRRYYKWLTLACRLKPMAG